MLESFTFFAKKNADSFSLYFYFSTLNALGCVSQVAIIINGNHLHFFIIVILCPEHKEK